jgi:hypothetical protein
VVRNMRTLGRKIREHKINATLAVMALAIAVLAIGRGKPGDIVFDSLVESLRDGPIEITPLDDTKKLIPRELAIAAVRTDLGYSVAPINSWAAIVTDHEYMSGLLRDRPCWLLELPHVMIRYVNEEPCGRESLFVVLDGEMGSFLEAFTKPQEAWWKRLAKKNARSSEKAKPLLQPPRFTLSQLTYDFRDNPPFYRRCAQQIIIRCFCYTDHSCMTMGLNGDKILVHENRPIWQVAAEGTNQPWGAPEAEQATCRISPAGKRWSTTLMPQPASRLA